MKSNLYRYNNTWQWLLNAKIAKSVEKLDGYRPMPVNVRVPFKVSFVDEKEFKADKRCVNYLERIRKVCLEKGIKLVLTYTPSLVLSKSGGVEKWLIDYCQKTGTVFMNFGKMKEFYEHPELFYDMTHLNEQGAAMFSRLFVETLKNGR